MNEYNLKSTRGNNLSANSIKQYNSGLNKLIEILKTTHKEKNPLVVYNISKSKFCEISFDRITQSLNEYKNPKTKKGLSQSRKKDLLKAVKAFVLGWDDDEDKTQFKENLENELSRQYATYFKTIENNVGKKTDKDKKNEVSWEELIKRREALRFSCKALMLKHKESLSAKEYKTLQNLAISAVYTYVPPRRNIFREIKIIDKKQFNKVKKTNPEENFLVISANWREAFFYFGDQKSSGHQKIVHIPKKLKKIIKLKVKHSHSDYLFTKVYKRDAGVNTNTFGKYINETFRGLGGKDAKIGCVSIRKAYDSRPEIREKLLEAHKIAESMGHSVNTAITYYSKIKLKIAIT